MKIKFLLLSLLAMALGYFLLITPDNPIMRAFRGEISDVNANVIIGPYPVAKDFDKLKKSGVETIVSLLDPAIPYEGTLIEQETVLAKSAGMKLLNFPMISILGKKMGEHYEQNAAAAAAAIASAKGKVYVHCYLGIHRVMVVKKLLDERKIVTGRYTFQQGERSELAIELDKAEQLYHQGYYDEARNVLDSMPSQGGSAKLLYAWVVYHQGNIGEARARFKAVTGLSAEARDREIGLAYCDLRENRLAEAAESFSRVLSVQPGNDAALAGMGIALYRQGHLKPAADYLERALQINPANAEAAEILRKARGPR